MAKGRRPSLESLDAKIAKLERTIMRGRAAQEKLAVLDARRKEIAAIVQNSENNEAEKLAKLQAKLETQRAKVAALETKLATAAPSQESTPTV